MELPGTCILLPNVTRISGYRPLRTRRILPIWSLKINVAFWEDTEYGDQVNGGRR